MRGTWRALALQGVRAAAARGSAPRARRVPHGSREAHAQQDSGTVRCDGGRRRCKSKHSEQPTELRLGGMAAHPQAGAWAWRAWEGAGTHHERGVRAPQGAQGGGVGGEGR